MNYPNKINKGNNNVYYGNRGMTLENDINETNKYYLLNDIAIIHKKPTPITINKVDYKSRMDAVIKEAYFKTPSTTDYNGIYKGKYIDFEAKETKLKAFPLSNIHTHQIKHLKSVMKHGGISFLIVRFTLKGTTYLLPTIKLLEFIDNNTRKSIPHEYFVQEGFLIKDNYNPRVDYLSVIEGEIE